MKIQPRLLAAIALGLWGCSVDTNVNPISQNTYLVEASSCRNGVEAMDELEPTAARICKNKKYGLSYIKRSGCNATAIVECSEDDRPHGGGKNEY